MRVVAAALAGVAAWTIACRGPGASTSEARFVGSAACASCHRSEYAAWRASQHAASMQEADSTSVLARVDATLPGPGGPTAPLARRDGRYAITAEGDDGQRRQYPIRYTFGVAPLQQYLVDLGGGRLHAVDIAWDARPTEAGGQRWFRLASGAGPTHEGDLHWSNRQQNWNFMCADCHSTAVRKGYDAAADQYTTQWAEINVGCEACHGPASRHVRWAKYPAFARALVWRDPRLTAAALGQDRAEWVMDSSTGIARRRVPRASDAEVQLCAQCHSRRSQIADGYHPGKSFFDFYLPALLVRGLYHADGQQRDEVYNYGSFIQSRMYNRGVTCSDCHDPHTQRLRQPGNATCTRCHLPSKYDAPAHHHHVPQSPGASCASCHMPATLYMQIDARRDHSIRVPRPDLTVSLGTPNACASCHTTRDARWADSAVRAWYGPTRKGFQTFAHAFAADDSNAADAGPRLRAIAMDTAQSDIARASALARLGPRADASDTGLAAFSARHPSPLIRLGALELLEGLAPAERLAAIGLLTDSLRAVRTQAAWVLAAGADRLPGPNERAAFARARDEFIASQRFNADRAESRTTLGTFFMLLGEMEQAAAEFRAAVALEPRFVPAYVNLADVERARGREAEAERTLRQALNLAPSDARLHHALGLSLARSGRQKEAVAELAKAAAAAPDDPTYAYAYAVALNSTGDTRGAIRALETARRRHPTDGQLLYGLALFQRDAGNAAAARAAAAELVRLRPNDEAARALAASLNVPRR